MPLDWCLVSKGHLPKTLTEDTMPAHPSQADTYNINASEDNRRALRLFLLTHTTEALFYLTVVVCHFLSVRLSY